MINQKNKLSMVICAIAALLALVLPCTTFGVTLPDLTAVHHGPHIVGFKTIEVYDYTRTFRASRDYFGNPIEGETARPMQICVWYPATALPDAQPLSLAEYAFPYPERQELFNFVSALQNRENGRMQGMFGTLDMVLSLFSGEVGAVRGAPEVEGKFPVVIYAGDRTTGIIDNAPLCEYLASYGYVVAGLQSVGTTALNPMMTVRDLETQARDMELTLAQMRDDEQVDMSRVAVVGRGQGAQAAVLFAIRNSSVGAVMVLGGLAGQGESSPVLLEHPEYDASALWVPILHVGSQPGMCDAFRFSDRTSLTDSLVTPMSLSYYGVIAGLRPEADTAQAARSVEQYQHIFPYVHDFLVWKFEADSAAGHGLSRHHRASKANGS